MSRFSLNPGDVLIVAPDKMVAVTEDGLSPHPGFSLEDARRALQDPTHLKGHVVYKAWEEETQTSYSPPQSYLDEVERRQDAVAPVPDAEPEVLGKIQPTVFDPMAARQGLM
jgi:hypothetical protein